MSEVPEQDRSEHHTIPIPVTTPDYYELGLQYKSSGDLHNAIRTFEKEVTQNPDNIDAWLALGRTRARLGTWMEALIDLQHVIHCQPKHHEAYYFIGCIHNELGQYKEAIDEFTKAIRYDSGKLNANYHYKRGYACQMDGQYELAIKSYTSYIDRSQEAQQHFGLLNRGLCYYITNRYDNALADFNRAVELSDSKNKSYCLCCRGRTKVSLDDPNGATKDFSLALELAPSSYEKGLANNELLQHREAIESYTRAINRNQNVIDASFRRGLSHAVLKEYPEAIVDFTKAIEGSRGSHHRAYFRRGLANVALRKYQQALDDYSSAIRIAKYRKDVYLMRAQLYLQLGRTEEASKDFKEAAFWEQQEHVEDTPPATPEPEPSPEQEYIDPKSSRGRLIAAAINDLEGNSEGAMVNLREVAGLSDIETILRGIKVIKEKGGLLTKEDRAILDALHAAERRKKQQEEALKSFQGNVNLKTYYNVFHLQLEAMFSGCKTVASGFVDHTAEGKLGILANGINLFGKLVSFVPGVSEAAAQVIGIAADVVTAIDHEQQTNILKYIANLGSTAALWEVSQSVAQRLTERYRNQLEQIMTLEEAKKAAPITDSIAKRCIVSCSRTKREITKEEEPSDVKEIADYGVFLIIEALQSQIIDQEESLVGQLVRIVCFANERQSLIEKITTRLGVSNKILRWRTGDRCSLHEFYSKPNILVKDEQGSSGAPVEH